MTPKEGGNRRAICGRCRKPSGGERSRGWKRSHTPDVCRGVRNG